MEKFKFVLSKKLTDACGGIGEGTIFTAIKQGDSGYLVTWENSESPTRTEKVEYPKFLVDEYVTEGSWKVLD